MSVSLLAPIAYVALLFGPLYLFSKHYMTRQKFRKASATSWFPQHHSRDLYISLLSHNPPVPSHILSAALLARAMTDVDRIVQTRDSKTALSSLLQKSLIGDSFWNEFLEAEKELEAEVREVMEEANTFNPNWGKVIFAQASDMVQHNKFKNVVKDLSTPLPQVRLVAGPPPGQQGTPQQGENGQQQQQQQLPIPANMPTPRNMTPEQQRQIAEAASKMTPQQLQALQQMLQAKREQRDDRSSRTPLANNSAQANAIHPPETNTPATTTVAPDSTTTAALETEGATEEPQMSKTQMKKQNKKNKGKKK